MAALKLLALSFILAVSPFPRAFAALSFGYYSQKCPHAEAIVASRVLAAFQKDDTVSAPLLRLHFHDCFVQGCDASVLLDSTPGNKAEKDADPNLSLAAFDVVDDIKRHLETACPRTVSCADTLALAARDGIYLAGGPHYEVPLGRRDGLTSFALAADTFLPGATLNVSGLVSNFAAVGLDIIDMVTLSGAHTIGQGHCTSFKNRLKPNAADPTMAPAYSKYLNKQCGAPRISGSTVVHNDFVTPTKFDNQYYKNLLNKYGTFTSDQSLVFNRQTLRAVKVYAKRTSIFFKHFKESVVKMGKINPLTGTEGEVRVNCHKRN